MVEGDIKDCFEDIKFDTLYPLIKRHVADNGFERLIRKYYKAGYIVNGHKEVSGGILQGSPLRPILINIILHELDVFISKEQEKLDIVCKRPKANPEYTRLIRKENKRAEIIKRDRMEIVKRRVSSRVYGPENNRLKYVRYADDFIVGIAGSKQLAEDIKLKISEFLERELGLNISIRKSKVTNLVRERVIFLGAEIHKTPRKKLPYKNGKVLTPRIKISAPIRNLIDKLMAEGIGKKIDNNKWKP